MVGEGEKKKSHERGDHGNVGNEENKEVVNRKIYKK